LETRSEDARHAWEKEIDRALPLPSFPLGIAATHSIHHDPKHLCFVLSRYKFAAKMLAGKQRVLEVGCGDGFGLPLVSQAVGSVVALDGEPRLIDDNKKRMGAIFKNVTFAAWDLIAKPYPATFDAFYALDVLEHVAAADEDRFLGNITSSLVPDGVAVIGVPNLTANAYASPESKACHINLKGHKELRSTLEKHFKHVFLFSMNDEVLHTGFYPMAHYLMALAVGVRTHG
jgi:2-polyprenyl-3-methyl-5-hydroxy-6-metoxy-1,4-benzoquinol methylase